MIVPDSESANPGMGDTDTLQLEFAANAGPQHGAQLAR
jgi:hypothetical protein